MDGKVSVDTPVSTRNLDFMGQCFRLLSARPPEKALEVDPALTVDNNSLVLKELPLQLISPPDRKRYFPRPVYHPVPRQVVGLRIDIEDAHHLAGAARVAGHGRQLAVGGDSPAADFLDRRYGQPGEIFHRLMVNGSGPCGQEQSLNNKGLA